METGRPDFSLCPRCGHDDVAVYYDETRLCPECGYRDGESRKEFWCPDCGTYNMTFTSDRAVCSRCGCTVLFDYDGPSENAPDDPCPAEFKLLHVRKAEVLPGPTRLSHSFSEFTELEEVILPEGIGVIDWNAFSCCLKLQKVNIPRSVREIRGSAFLGCAFEEILLPEGLDRIGELTFGDCGNLRHIEIPDGVRAIGDAAFQYCVALREITVPASVEEIGDSAFRGCTALTAVRILNPECRIAPNAFDLCPNVKIEI